MELRIDFNKLVGSGYVDELWNNTHRFICLSGSRASGKSTFGAYRAIKDLLTDEFANILYIRNTYNTLKDSCFAEIQKILTAPDRLGNTPLKDYFEFKTSPLEIKFWRNGKNKGVPQHIYFRGFDKADKLQSISPPKGYIKTVIIDEAHEIESSDEFDKLNFSIRDEKHLQQFIIIQNMYSKYGWVYQNFYKQTPPNALALIKNFECNDFLSEESEFYKTLQHLKETKPNQYLIYSGKKWGGAESTVYDEEDYEIVDNLVVPESCEHICGLDFGFTNDPTALVSCHIDHENKSVYVDKLVYNTRMLNSDIAKYLVCKTIADCASPKDIADLNKLRPDIDVIPCRKGKDSIEHGIRQVKEYKIYVDSKLTPLIEELQKYEYDENTHKPKDKFNHALDALRYVIMHINKPQSSVKSYNLKKIRKRRR